MKDTKTIMTVSDDPKALLTAINSEMLANNPGFASYLPIDPTVEGALKEFGTAVNTYQPVQNEFIDTLINLIGRVWIQQRMFTNPLRVFKKGILEYGDTVEMVYTQRARMHHFDPVQAETEWMKREIPTVFTLYAKRDYMPMYKATISDDQLRAAFMGWAQLSDFISSVFNSMYTAMEDDEYNCMLLLLKQYAADGKFAVETIPEVTDKDSAANALAIIKGVSNDMVFMRDYYNGLGVVTNTPKEKQVLLINAKFDALLDVQGYATLFNLEPARAQYRKVMIGNFPEGMENVPAVLVDEDFYCLWECLRKFTRDMNGEGLYWQYWSHLWEIMALCPFANAVAFTTVAPTVTGVTVTPATQVIAKGQSGKVTANVTGTGFFPHLVTWTISGNTDATTNIAPTGTLTMGKNETGTVTITATSKFDTTKSGTATATTTNPA